MFGATKRCAKCEKQVYPIEELKCLDKIWHKNCFKCTVCNSLLNMKNYKGFDKQPYCVVHYPQQKPTVVSDNPELLRIKENTKIQSNAKYHEDFEKSKGTYTVVADDPETRRILENTKNISQVKYHEDFEKNIKNKNIPSGVHNNNSNTNGNTNNIIINNCYQSERVNGTGVFVQQPGLVATYKSGGNGEITNNKTTALQSNGNGNANSSNGSNSNGHMSSSSSSSLSQQRKIGSIADYDPLSYETTKTTVMNDRFGRSVFSTGNLQNGNSNASSRMAPAYNSTSNIGSYMNSNGTNGIKNGYGHYQNGSNGNHTVNNYNHNLEYDISVQNHQHPQPQPFYQSDIKTSVYKAIYDYDAKEDDEISFRDGDKFINCEQIDVGWMIGVHEKTGKHGMFPANYAEPVDYF